MDTDEITLEKDMFGSKITIAIYDIDRIIGDPLMEQAYNQGLRLQKIFNFYDKESELSRLNNTRELTVSEDMKRVISEAMLFCDLTQGEYDIALGKKILNRKKGIPNTDNETAGCSYKDIDIDGMIVRLRHPDVMIDLGSIAKGYIADKIGDYLKNNGVINGMVDARGDMVFFGDYEHIIEIQHPRDEKKAIMTIKIKNASVATSGDYRQYNNDYSNSHIINQKEFISITVVAPSLMKADAYATALFVCDKEQRDRLLQDKDIKVMMVDKDLNIAMYNGFETLIA
jgi:thiamine biosynthesis lipoprotein